MSLPPCSMIEHVDLVERQRGTSARAGSVSSCSAGPPTSSAVSASTSTTSPVGRLDRGDAAEQPARRPSAAMPASSRSRIATGPHGVELRRRRAACRTRRPPSSPARSRSAPGSRVRLDPVDRQDHGRRPAAWRSRWSGRADRVVCGDDDGVHRRPDLGADAVLGDAERRPAWRAGPRRSPRRGCPSPARRTARRRARAARDRAPQQLDAAGQAAAAGADGHGRARTRAESAAMTGGHGGRLDVVDGVPSGDGSSTSVSGGTTTSSSGSATPDASCSQPIGTR